MLAQNQKIENIPLLAKQAVEGFIIGLHKSPFHGFSVEFAEHKLYNAGDNLKYIDWKVYGRSDKLFIKKYEEETNLRCHVVIDTSSSMLFPNNAKHYNKLQFSSIAAGALLYVLKGQQDAGALTFFDSTINFNSPCKSSSIHFNNLNTELEKLLQYTASQKSTNTTAILHQIADSIHRRSLVVIFSDMLDSSSELEQILDALQHLKYNKHEVILFHVTDSDKEINFNFENRPYEFIDLETGESIKLNSLEAKKEYVSKIKAYKEALSLRCAQYNIDLIDADVNKSFDQILLPYLVKRNKMS